MSAERFDFDRRGEDFDMTSAVYQALGAASMCWQPVPKGVFDSSRAKEIGEALLAEIEEFTTAEVKRSGA